MSQTPEATRRPAGPEGRPKIDMHDELVMLRETFVGRPAGVKLGGLVVLAGVLALLASPDIAHRGATDARHPLKLGLLQPSVSVAAQDPCPSQKSSEGISPAP